MGTVKVAACETLHGLLGEIGLHIQLQQSARPRADEQIRRLFHLAAKDPEHAATVRDIAEELFIYCGAAFSAALLRELRQRRRSWLPQPA
jgi:hypothetical protein